MSSGPSDCSNNHEKTLIFKKSCEEKKKKLMELSQNSNENYEKRLYSCKNSVFLPLKV